MHHLKKRIHTLRKILESSATHSVKLIAVSKYHSAQAIEQAFALGCTDFGENTLQIALPKMEKCKNIPAIWHFIGRLQSNKIKRIAHHFDWVHSVATLKDLTLLNSAAQDKPKPLNVCIQISLDRSTPQRHCPVAALHSHLQYAHTQPYLKLRGLMYLPPPHSTQLQTQNNFEKVAKLFTQAQQAFPSLDTLCMGMTQDYQDAILAGATCIRIGRGIFGKKQTDI